MESVLRFIADWWWALPVAVVLGLAAYVAWWAFRPNRIGL